MKRLMFLAATACLLAFFGFFAATNSAPTFYPAIEIESLETARPPLKLQLVFDAQPTLQQCEALAGNVARLALAKCPFCVMRQVQCATSLTEDQKRALSETALQIPSGRFYNGVVLFNSSDPAVALGACQESQRQSLSSTNPLRCDKSGDRRPNPGRPALPLSLLALTALVFLGALLSAWLTGWVILRYEHLHAKYTHDHIDAGPQKFHATPTPRIGGIAVATGLIAAGATILFLNELPHEREFGLLLLAAIPAFMGGLVEDVTKKVGVSERLLLTMLSGAVAAWYLNAVINRIGLPLIDDALLIPALAVAFTIFAVGGVANAINIIDGYNGLAGGFAVIVLAAIAWVAGEHGDMFILATALALAGSVIGFLCWNWPKGRIFFGDGGAYLVGFMLAELSVLLVVRNPGVSPWFPLLLLIYPVFETFFSIYRRKLRRGLSPGQPDNRHLHQLIYRCIALINESKVSHNSRVAIRLLAPTMVVALVAISLHDHHWLLIAGAVTYCLLYLLAYEILSKRAKKIRKNRASNSITDKTIKYPFPSPRRTVKTSLSSRDACKKH